MQTISQALDEVKDLYRSVVGQEAPDIAPESFVSFPHGVDPLHHALSEIQHVKELTERLRTAPKPVAWVPQADCLMIESELITRLDLPGVSREDIQVLVADGECVVRGERKPPIDDPQVRPMNVERPWGPFERRFPLPAGSPTEKIVAKYVDGILELRIPIEAPKATEAKTVTVG